MQEFGFIHKASIHIQSQFHHYLFCKVVDPFSKAPLASSLIAHKPETELTINRYIQDFQIQLYKNKQIIATFCFDEDDLKHINRTVNREEMNLIKKYSDECTIIFRIHYQPKNYFRKGQFNRTNICDDLHLKVAKETYEKLQAKALKIITRSNANKLRNKKFSTILKDDAKKSKEKQHRKTWTKSHTSEEKKNIKFRGKKSKFSTFFKEKFRLNERRKLKMEKGTFFLKKKKAEYFNIFQETPNSLFSPEKTPEPEKKQTLDRKPFHSISTLSNKLLTKTKFCEVKTKFHERGHEIISYQPTFSKEKHLSHGSFHSRKSTIRINKWANLQRKTIRRK